MTPRQVTNIAASVHQRLLNMARASSRPFNELLQHYAIERFLYRLSNTGHADQFVLKGALMLSVWGRGTSRPTMDIDLLGRIDNNLGGIADAVKDACVVSVVEDGLSYDPQSVMASRIAEDAHYEGVRVRVRGNLGNARITLQIDVGFGDVIVPGTLKVVYPALLDYPAPELIGYTRESSIAEKFQAMVKLGALNSRMKDFYDIWALCQSFDFEGATISQAVRAAFGNRHTPVSAQPTVFEPSFAKDPGKDLQWRGFVAKSRLDNAPAAFEDAVAVIKAFLGPVAAALAEQKVFRGRWTAPGPWRVLEEQ